MSSKARYYLEQCIPEVDDLVEHGIFNKSEVTSIMKKRTNFEHRLNSRGSSISDYIRYVEFEKNVDKLRLKRIKRILQNSKKYSVSDYSIQHRIDFIFQRGCNKFPQDLRFWSLYLNYLKSRGNKVSYKKIHSVYNQLLRLHPTNVDVWISCAKFEYEVYANFKSCRTVFQNSLRFNPDSSKLWFEYCKFELNFVTKLITRRKVLNLINEREQEMDMLHQEKANVPDDSNEHEDGIKLPSTGDNMKDKLNELPDTDMSMLGNEETNPALRGDIALTIYDLAMKNLRQKFIEKRRGFYAVTDGNFEKELIADVNEYLYTISLDYIKLFDNFKALRRDYLITHVLHYLKTLDTIKSSKEYSSYITFIDITLNIRYMDTPSFNNTELQKSVQKYLVYKSKIKDKELLKLIRVKYSEYLREKYLINMEKDSDPRYSVLAKIINKL
ncbi:probable U3 small nucleolar RNA-associated protein 6 [Saccharomycodes ludwigii]|uniref:Probable U3 small nucleolar RNA-associated protein 6 n=1 Tax=Saccharomycodes ludwigii TaxID=36035 RepID=A0A376B3H4_9ASCO|nr:hypothetical protein SCDLUD_004939 [Saccharomycodes ludwigii]KAH3899494.1 hypothetical protein SCDLUD_004939 [Saccharomycodes ludwigii]SSD59139.1 probable U3 small nucleolar RNA-associated protein 6 [Saccharomycodes ludwigii]